MVKTKPPAQLIAKGLEVKTTFRPHSKFNCKPVTTSVLKNEEGALDINFVYQ